MTADDAWMSGAKCADHNTDLWFPPIGQGGAKAKAICHTCPVKGQCLEFAIEHDEVHGIWGGTSGRERERLRRQLLANGALRRLCVVCSGRFTPTIHQQRMCSDECRAVARVEQQRRYVDRIQSAAV